MISTYARAPAIEWLDLQGVRVPVASPATLIRTKITDRPQDALERGFLAEVLAKRRR